MDYTNRLDREAKLARAIARLSASQRRTLFEIMGDPPKIENVTAEYWNGALTEWRGVLTPELESIFVDSALQFLDSVPAGVDWDLINQGAADWARRHGDWLVRKLDETTRRGVREAIADYYEQGLNLGQLREKLGRWFSPVRADMIAATEVTRASSEGRDAIYREIGLQPTVFKAPAHQRCRCNDRTEILPGNVMVVVWQTNEDELVCTQPIVTPFGMMAGCRDLNDRVLTQGPWLGMKISDVMAAQ